MTPWPVSKQVEAVGGSIVAADRGARLDARVALAAQAPLLWEEPPGNLSYRFERGDKPAVDATFAAAAHIVEISCAAAGARERGEPWARAMA